MYISYSRHIYLADQLSSPKGKMAKVLKQLDLPGDNPHEEGYKGSASYSLMDSDECKQLGTVLINLSNHCTFRGFHVYNYYLTYLLVKILFEKN